MFATLFASQIVAAVGYGGVPWSVPSLLSGAAGPGKPLPGPGGIALVLAVGGRRGGGDPGLVGARHHDR